MANCVAGAVATAVAAAAGAVSAQERAVPRLDPIVVTATRTDERAFDLPLAIDSVDRDRIQNGQLQVNLSESLAGIPGISVQNRWNYAQDLQVSVRGFGARANFGVRGVRLYQDYIPATMPDGQGQTGSFSLASAQRIEVLRGPFSSLYGNASGGVISVFTEDGPVPPIAGGQVIGGSYGTWNTIARAGGQSGAVNYLLAGNYFTIDGYRDHSHASRELGNVKLRLDASPDTSIVIVANALYQPEAEDPLGLTRAQWEANPRQADPAAVLFDTRKTVSQRQAGATVLQKLTEDADLRVTGYGGTRSVRQFLALPGIGATSSGGVSDIDRSFGGVDARVIYRFRLADRPGTLTLGGNAETQRDQRKGFVNNNGQLGDLRRDETDSVGNGDGYAQLEFAPLDALSLLAGYRYSNVRFDTSDHYIAPGNPDDSGQRNYSHGSPVVGAVWHVTDRLNLYANYGQGFETPTFIELAYRPVGSGLNLALQPSVSDSAEAGLKALISRTQRVNVAVFDVKTSDEIVVDTSTGGRTTYKNAAKTERKGVEAAWQGDLGAGFAG
ncbi:MAG TPA: TonB-dependent receptor, partial [Casimicrobiaceae bacterium]|nr:TonB-dependent receptor [Casimicrobiaceae bacterium]